MIDKDKIEERIKVLQNDINIVRDRLAENEQKRLEDTALLNGLSGALQQCSMFLEEKDDDEPEMASDDGNEDSEYGG